MAPLRASQASDDPQRLLGGSIRGRRACAALLTVAILLPVDAPEILIPLHP